MLSQGMPRLLSALSVQSNPSLLSILSILGNSPARLGPVYSSSTETKAHECLFQPRSVFDSIWNNSRTLQNQTLSIQSWKALCEMPGGRMKTKSWRLDALNFFPWNCHEEMRCSCGCFVCPIASVVKTTIWPEPPVDFNFRRVSRKICNKNEGFRSLLDLTWHLKTRAYDWIFSYAIYNCLCRSGCSRRPLSCKCNKLTKFNM